MDNVEIAKQHFFSGIEYFNLLKFELAEIEFREANKLTPDRVSILTNLAGALIKQGKYNDALSFAKRSIELDELNYEGWVNLAICQLKNCHLDLALESISHALALNTGELDGLLYKAEILQQLHQFDEAIIVCDKYIDNYKNSPYQPTDNFSENLTHILIIKFYSLLYTCSYKRLTNETEVINSHLSQLISSHQDKKFPSSIIEHINSFLFYINYLDFYHESFIYNWHLAWSNIYKRNLFTQTDAPNIPTRNRLSRIGYISPDFREHSVSYFFMNIISHHNKEFEIYCYSTTHAQDSITELIRSNSYSFKEVNGLPHHQIANIIHHDDLDILIHLGGYTGNGVPQILAYKPTPLQIWYLGYPNTSGADFVDYWITDQYAHIHTDSFHSEKLLRLPESFLCFGSFDAIQTLAMTPASISGKIMFGSFNNVAKLSSATIRLWSLVLSAIPNSTLLIKSLSINLELTKNNILSEFKANNISEDRILFCTPLKSKSSHLELYNQIDIALDSIPYNGTTTTCEALWMGVPVLTLVGEVHRQRVSYSILKNIGVEDSIAYSEEEFVEIGKNLAEDLRSLTTLRHRIAKSIRNSILCDPERFTRQFEDALHSVYESHKNNQQIGS